MLSNSIGAGAKSLFLIYTLKTGRRKIPLCCFVKNSKNRWQKYAGQQWLRQHRPALNLKLHWLLVCEFNLIFLFFLFYLVWGLEFRVEGGNKRRIQKEMTGMQNAPSLSLSLSLSLSYREKRERERHTPTPARALSPFLTGADNGIS